MENDNVEPEIEETTETVETTEEVVEIPEGFDEEIYDTSTKSLNQEKVAERLKNLNEQVANAKKQANDMRKKLSKGTTGFESAEEYTTNYTPDDKYVSYYEADDVVGKHLNEVVGILSKFSYEHNLSAETAKDLNNLFMQYAEDIKIIDTRTDEEKAQALASEKEKIGENADAIIQFNNKWLEDSGVFSTEEKEYFKKLIDKDALCNTALNKLITLTGVNGSADIPVRGNIVNGLADDRTLAREYYAEETTDSRRMEILQQRIDAGRKGGLPMP